MPATCSTSATTTASCVLLDDSPPTEQADNVRNAAAACPALAIDIEE